MLVRSGCVGPHYVVPAFGGGEGWVGRTLDAIADALSAQKLLFEFPQPLEVTDVRFEEVPGVG